MPTTPKHSSATCRLNSKFLRALEGTAFDTRETSIYGRSSGKQITRVDLGSTHCCGIDELDFQPLQDVWEEYPKNWNELVARYIKASCDRSNDERVVFVGIPTRVGTQSMYTIKFYEKLRDTLKEFGFRELCKPYRNANSGNNIVVLAGQMPG